MKKRLISMLLALLAVMGLLPTAAFAASTPEEALGEVQIYNGGVEMSYLSINGRIRSQIYTYYNYDNGSGSTREIPAYCVNPNTLGVPQTVGVGESTLPWRTALITRLRSRPTRISCWTTPRTILKLKTGK